MGDDAAMTLRSVLIGIALGPVVFAFCGAVLGVMGYA